MRIFGSALAPRTLWTAALLGLVWSAFVLMEVIKQWRYSDADPFGSVPWAAFVYYPWFPISLLIGWLAMRWPLDRARRWTFWGLHLGTASLIGIVHLLLLTASFWLFDWPWVDRAIFSSVFEEQFLEWFHFEVGVYFAVLALWYLVRADRSTEPARPASDVIVGSADGEKQLVRPAQVDWVEAAGNYVILHTGSRRVRVRATLKEMLDRLDPHRFLRCHRSALVNLKRISRIGPQRLTLANGERAPVSRRYRATLLHRLKPPAPDR